MTDLLARLQAALGDPYAVERELGGGGMGRVFVALERGLDRRVAVKVLSPELAAAVSVERFRREIQLAASLQHPHIVPLLTAGEAEGLLYYTMPFIDGETLRARLLRDARLPVPDAVRILRDVLDALAYAHRRGVVHRDIKPENILLVDDHALVTDFGVAKALTQATGGGGLTSAGIALGTPAYMAPEQAAGDQADHRSDVYAAGVLAYEMLGGQPPFRGEAQRVLAAQVMDHPEPMARLRADVPPVLASSVMRCLEKDPANRWQSAADLRREIEGTPGGAPAARPRRRPWGRVAAVLVVAGAAVAGWAVWRARPSTSSTASPTLVAVLPFAVRGSAAVAYLGEGMVSLLSTSLDGAGDLRAVDPHAVFSVVQRRGAGLLDPTSAAAVAERLGAGRYVLGDVVEAAGRIQITASLFDRGQGAVSPLARGTVEGNSGQVFSLVDELATQLLAASSSGPTGRVTRIASVTTSSLAAYKAYLDGEAAFRAGRADSAVAAFERAVGLDTAFALAYYRLSVAAEWATLSGSYIARTAEQAVRHSARLAEHDRLLLEALVATRRGAAPEAERRYRAILGTYPDDIEAWSQLGEVLFHYGPEQGRPLAEARAPFERVLYFDPGYVNSLVHLARIAAVEGRHAVLDSLVGLIDKLSPSSDRELEMHVLRAYALGDVPAQQRVLSELARAAEPTLALPIWDVAVFAKDPEGAETIARLMVDPTRSVDARAAGHVSLAYLALVRGKLAAARAELSRAGSADSVRALEYGALLELAPFLNPARTVLDAARRALDRLAAVDGPPRPHAAVYFSAHDGFHHLLRAYLLGLLSARLRDFAAAERYGAMLARETGPPAAAGLPRDLALEIRAEEAIAQGAPASALALLRQTGGETWYEYHFASPFLAGSRARYRRAGLEAALGDARQAIALYGGFEGFSGYALVYAAPSYLRRAQLYERLGDQPAAAAHYTRFLTLWKDADPEFRPMLDSARAAYQRVTSPR